MPTGLDCFAKDGPERGRLEKNGPSGSAVAFFRQEFRNPCVLCCVMLRPGVASPLPASPPEHRSGVCIVLRLSLPRRLPARLRRRQQRRDQRVWPYRAGPALKRHVVRVAGWPDLGRWGMGRRKRCAACAFFPRPPALCVDSLSCRGVDCSPCHHRHIPVPRRGLIGDRLPFRRSVP